MLGLAQSFAAIDVGTATCPDPTGACTYTCDATPRLIPIGSNNGGVRPMRIIKFAETPAACLYPGALPGGVSEQTGSRRSDETVLRACASVDQLYSDYTARDRRFEGHTGVRVIDGATKYSVYVQVHVVISHKQ